MIPQFIIELTKDTPEHIRATIYAAWENGYQHGYDAGFSVSVAAEKGIKAIEAKIKELEGQPPAHFSPELGSATAGVTGPSELQKEICGSFSQSLNPDIYKTYKY